jgi:transposase
VGDLYRHQFARLLSRGNVDPYRRRWKIERLFAWLQNFCRLVVRCERYAENFLGMLYLGCRLILLRHI